MALELQRELSSGVPNPPRTHAAFYVDENGQPVLKSSDGVVTSAMSLSGDALVLNEQGGPPGTGVDDGAIYSKDVDGVTEFFYQDDSDNGSKETQVTSDGAMLGLIEDGIGTWFEEGTESVDLDVTIVQGGGLVLDTGLVFPINGDEQLTQMYVRSMSVGDGAHDLGWINFTFGWNTAPTLPIASLLGDHFKASTQAGNLPNISQILQDASLDASGVLSLIFSDPKDFDFEGRLKVILSPGFNLEINTVPIPCFVAGTMVHTPEGLKAIETLTPDDVVFAFDADTMQVVEAPVVNLHVHEGESVFELVAGETMLLATGNHPFYLEEHGKYERLDHLERGYQLRQLDGQSVPVESIKPQEQPQTVYNITVDGLHNYFVGQHGILVHNK